MGNILWIHVFIFFSNEFLVDQRRRRHSSKSKNLLFRLIFHSYLLNNRRIRCRSRFFQNKLFIHWPFKILHDQKLILWLLNRWLFFMVSIRISNIRTISCKSGNLFSFLQSSFTFIIYGWPYLFWKKASLFRLCRMYSDCYMYFNLMLFIK